MWTRRNFLTLPVGCAATRVVSAQQLDLVSYECARVLRAADAYLRETPVTVTAATSPRTTGGRDEGMTGLHARADYFF